MRMKTGIAVSVMSEIYPVFGAPSRFRHVRQPDLRIVIRTHQPLRVLPSTDALVPPALKNRLCWTWNIIMEHITKVASVVPGGIYTMFMLYLPLDGVDLKAGGTIASV